MAVGFTILLLVAAVVALVVLVKRSRRGPSALSDEELLAEVQRRGLSRGA